MSKASYIDKRTLMLVSATLAVILAVTASFFLLLRFTPEAPVTALDEGWTVTLEDGTVLENVSADNADDVLDVKANRGDKVTRSLTLPGSIENYHTPYYYERVSFAAVEVFLEDKKILSENLDRVKEGKYVSGTDYYIDLDGAKAGQEIRIDYYLSEDKISPTQNTPLIGNYLDLVYSFLHDNLFPLLSGIFLCVFGVFFLILSIILSAALPELLGQLISSVISLIFGIWILSVFMISPLFFDLKYRGDIEYVCFFACVPLMYLLFMQIHEIKEKKIFMLMAGGSSLLILIFMILHFLDIVHMSEARLPYFVLVIGMMATIVGYDIDDIRQKKFNLVNMVQMAGLTAYSLLGFAALIYYLSAGFFFHKPPTSGTLLIMTTGCLAFALTRFMVYFLLVAETDPRRLEFKSLSEAAYLDTLTGTGNRNFYDDAMRRLENSRSPYAIMSMDLNGLKEVNDRLGHGAGDNLLRTFGNILVKETPGDARCARIGGDEFVMILEDGEKGVLESAMKRIKNSLRELNNRGGDIEYSAAFGIAYSTEAPGENPQHIFMLADKRMYDDKRKTKMIS